MNLILFIGSLSVATRTARRLCLGWALLALAPVALSAEEILVVRAPQKQFEEVKDHISREVEGNHSVKELVLDGDTTFEQFQKAVAAHKPGLLVLLDNKAIEFARRLFREDREPHVQRLRAVATMGINLKEILKDDPHIAGVAYEVPAFLLITKFRFMVRKPEIKRVLTIYRSSVFSDTIADAKRHLEREGIELIALDAESKGSSQEQIDKFVADNLKEEVGGKKVDAIWVMTDNKLINKTTFQSVWLARSRTFKIPFLCGVEKFATEEFNFCSYAASANHADLARQTAQTIFAILDEGEQVESLGVEYVVSDVKTVNLGKMRSLGLEINLEKDNL